MRKGCTSTKCHSAPGILVVLPNGCKEVFAINQSNTFGDLKRKIELQVGLPVELQNLELTDFDHPVGDWISTDILNGTNGSVVYLRTDRKWTQVIYACLRKGTEKALDILSSIEDSSVIENIIFVALLVSAAVGNEELITTLIEEAEEYLNLKGRTSSGRTILHIVVAGGHWTCIEALLSKIAHDFGGIDLLYVKDNDFESPLDIAKRAEQLDIVTKIKDFEFSHRSQYCLSREGSKEAICNPEVRMSKTDKFKPVHLKVSRQHSVPVGESLKAHSTPSSPHLTRPNKTNRLLHRPALTLQLSQNLSGSESDLRRLKRNSKARKTSLGSSLEGSPSISPCSLSPNSTPGHSPSHLSPTGYSYSSLYQRRRSSTEGEAHSAPHSPVTRSQKFMFDGGLHQVVHVPLWRRRGVNHNKEQDYGRRGSSARGYLSHSEGDHNVSDDEKHFEKYAR